MSTQKTTVSWRHRYCLQSFPRLKRIKKLKLRNCELFNAMEDSMPPRLTTA